MNPEQIRTGGLMRCCLQTLDAIRTPDQPPAQEGDRLHCLWCTETMVFKTGAWEWAPLVTWGASKSLR